MACAAWAACLLGSRASGVGGGLYFRIRINLRAFRGWGGPICWVQAEVRGVWVPYTWLCKRIQRGGCCSPRKEPGAASFEKSMCVLPRAKEMAPNMHLGGKTVRLHPAKAASVTRQPRFAKPEPQFLLLRAQTSRCPLKAGVEGQRLGAPAGSKGGPCHNEAKCLWSTLHFCNPGKKPKGNKRCPPSEYPRQLPAGSRWTLSLKNLRVVQTQIALHRRGQNSKTGPLLPSRGFRTVSHCQSRWMATHEQRKGNAGHMAGTGQTGRAPAKRRKPHIM